MTKPAETTRAKDSCPHCGRSTGLVWWDLLPSRDNKRFFVCKACGGHFVLSNASKMASAVGVMLGMVLGVTLPFGWIVKAGHVSKTSIIEGIVAVALTVGLVATTAARLTLKLEPKP